jgi:hypothetical protein
MVSVSVNDLGRLFWYIGWSPMDAHQVACRVVRSLSAIRQPAWCAIDQVIDFLNHTYDKLRNTYVR